MSESDSLCTCLWAQRCHECVYKKRERVCGVDPDVVRDELPGFSHPSCCSLQWGERLYRLKTPLCLPACLPRTASTDSHTTSSSTQHPLQEGREHRHDTRLSKRASELLMETQPNTKTHTYTHTNTQEFFSPLFSLLSPQKAVVSLNCFRCCYCCLFLSHLQNQIRKSGHWMDSWSCVM